MTKLLSLSTIRVWLAWRNLDSFHSKYCHKVLQSSNCQWLANERLAMCYKSAKQISENTHSINYGPSQKPRLSPWSSVARFMGKHASPRCANGEGENVSARRRKSWTLVTFESPTQWPSTIIHPRFNSANYASSSSTGSTVRMSLGCVFSWLFTSANVEIHTLTISCHLQIKTLSLTLDTFWKILHERPISACNSCKNYSCL